MPGLGSKDAVRSIKDQARQELERCILQGLACEWETAVLDLDPINRQSIRKPLFAIKELKTQWGNWSPEKREIVLSRRLVMNYPWDSIREVLLHEMAHQIAQQLLGASAQTPHGAAFHQACKILRIQPAASANYQPLQDRIRKHTPNHHDKRMLRVKKLLALAESKNRFEAEAAMTKAHELIARHNIALNHNETKNQYVSIFIGSPALRHHREDYHLANLLQDYYFVSGIWVSAYVISKGKMGRVLEISGTMQNLKLAEYVHGFIVHFIDAQWRKYNQAKKLNRFRKTDFAVGIIEGFRDKLAANIKHAKTQKDIFALIQKGDPQLEQYVKFKYPHTTSLKKTAAQQDARVMHDGKKVGKQLVIARGISERKTGNPRLISK